MINPKTLTEVVAKIVATAHPTKVILFGSCARNEMRKDSDLDLLVIEEQLKNKGKEMVRLRNVIGNIGVGVDVMVCSQQEVNEWGHLPGSALYSALKEGKILYEATH